MNAIERTDPVKLGDRLRIARSTAGLKQEDAARDLRHRATAPGRGSVTERSGHLAERIRGFRV